MSLGLSPSDVVRVDVVIAPRAAQRRSFGRLLILGSSDVIDTAERRRRYTTLDSVASEFGTNTPEYIAAALFFGQAPTPTELYIGRWARIPTRGRFYGVPLNAAQQAMSNFTGITSGAFAINIDSTQRTVSGVNLSGATNLNGVAEIIDTALDIWADVFWNASQQRFEVFSKATGTTSVVTSPTSTQLSTALGLPGGSGVAGIVAETAANCVALHADQSTDWYGAMFADPLVTNDELVAVAGFIEGASPSRILGVTTQEAGVLNAVTTTDLASRMRALGYARTIVQYSSFSPYAVASLFGRAFTVDFNANRSTITLKFKQQPGLSAELLPTSQANVVKSKNCNIFVRYQNDTAILQEGVVANGRFIDEVHGLDWLQNALQTDLYNLLYQSPTKIPQTEDGVNTLVTQVERTLAAAVNNGLAAPGTWTAQGFGKLQSGDFLPKGFYVYVEPLALQAQADREARRAPPISAAVKLAGAVHSANVILNVNR